MGQYFQLCIRRAVCHRRGVQVFAGPVAQAQGGILFRVQGLGFRAKTRKCSPAWFLHASMPLWHVTGHSTTRGNESAHALARRGG